jgi:hypothetical protein
LLIMKIVSPPKLPAIEELVKLVTEKLQSGVMPSAVRLVGGTFKLKSGGLINVLNPRRATNQIPLIV